MKNLNKFFITTAVVFSFALIAQENTEGEPTTIQGLLQLVEQGRTSEQAVNAQREAEFLANNQSFLEFPSHPFSVRQSSSTKAFISQKYSSSLVML